MGRVGHCGEQFCERHAAKSLYAFTPVGYVFSQLSWHVTSVAAQPSMHDSRFVHALIAEHAWSAPQHPSPPASASPSTQGMHDVFCDASRFCAVPHPDTVIPVSPVPESPPPGLDPPPPPGSGVVHEASPVGTQFPSSGG